MDKNNPIRDYGVLPAAGKIPVGQVRSELTRGNIFGQYLMTFLMLGGCAGPFLVFGIIAAIVGLHSWGTKYAVLIIGLPVMGSLACFLVWVTMKVVNRSNRWVELDGDIVRAKNLYTGKLTERRVAEIEEITTEVYLVANAAVRLTELFQGRVRGFAIKFPDLPEGIRVYRPEMNNVEGLIQAIAAKMSEHGSVAPEVINFEGRPMIRRLVWEDRLKGGGPGG